MICEKFKLNKIHKLLATLSYFRSLKREERTIASTIKYPMNEEKVHRRCELGSHVDTIKMIGT